MRSLELVFGFFIAIMAAAFARMAAAAQPSAADIIKGEHGRSSGGKAAIHLTEAWARESCA